jgi:alpha-1,2-mannosyltransferase
VRQAEDGSLRSMRRAIPSIETFLFGVAIVLAIWFGLSGFVSSTVIGDFGSFYESGKAASQGLNPYAIYPLTYAVTTATFCGYDQNLNPPTLLPFLELLSRLSDTTAFRVWTAMSLLSGALLLALLIRSYREQIDARAVLWFFALGASWDTLALGQLYIVLALVSAGAWVLLKTEHELSAGLLIGALAAIKPNFLVWPVLLMIAGHRKCATIALATALVALLGSLIVYGPTVWAQWLELLRADGARTPFPINGSLIGFFARFDAVALGYASAIALLIASAVWALIVRPPALTTSGVALTVSILTAPIGWLHYALLLLPIVFANWNDRGPVKQVVIWLLLIPPVFIAVADTHKWLVLATLGSVTTTVFLGVGYQALKGHARPLPITLWR